MSAIRRWRNGLTVAAGMMEVVMGRLRPGEGAGIVRPHRATLNQRSALVSVRHDEAAALPAEAVVV